MNYEIVVIGVDETTRPVGLVWWEMDSGKWGFKSDDPDVTDILRRVAERGHAEQWYSVEAKGSIGDAIMPVTAQEEGFVRALEDALVQANVVELREVK